MNPATEPASVAPTTPRHTPSACAAIDLRIGQHVRHTEFRGQRVTGVVIGLSLGESRELMADVVLHQPIIIPASADGRWAETSVHRQYVPVVELSPYDERDDLIADLLKACEGLLSVAETGITSLGAIRAGREVIAKAKGAVQ